MTQDEKCCKVSIDGWWGFCIYFEACRHRTATAAKHAIKETILEHKGQLNLAGLLLHPTPSHLHRAGHKKIPGATSYRCDFGVGMSLLGSGMRGATRPGTARYARDKPCTHSNVRIIKKKRLGKGEVRSHLS